MKLAKRNHYSNTLKAAIHDMKRTWMIHKEIIGKTKPKTSIPSKLNVFQEQSFLLQLEDPVLIAEFFNSFYKTVAQRTINPTNNSDHTNPELAVRVRRSKRVFMMSERLCLDELDTRR